MGESPPSDASAMSPADLAHLAGEGKVATRRRSILKPFSASDIRVREESVDTAGLDTEVPDDVWVKNLTDMIGDAVDMEPEAVNEVREPFINPIDDRIVERPVTTALSISEGEGGMSSAEPSRKVSRFKQSRVKK